MRKTFQQFQLIVFIGDKEITDTFGALSNSEAQIIAGQKLFNFGNQFSNASLVNVSTIEEIKQY